MSEELSREELHAALEVRREMGAEIEPALVDSLAAKVEATVRRRYEAELAASKERGVADKQGQGSRLALAIVSLVLAIPLTAITGQFGFAAMLMVWVGIVLVNVAMAFKRPG
ncbi:hypothetical protein [Tessaracoccus sp. G1721]